MNQRLYNIVLISPGQPSSNPRLVKEALSLHTAGYRVVVLYSFWAEWADSMDRQLFLDTPEIKWICVGGHPKKQKLLFWITRIKHKLSKYFSRLFPSSIYWHERALTRTGIELRRKASALPADLYIAHNLGALGSACIAAEKYHTKYTFDAEDYHRGEVKEGSLEYKRAVILENRYLPGVISCTAASPLIANRYQQDYPFLSPVVINNVFSRQFLQPEPAAYQTKDNLKLFWFSQTVGANRGLENVVLAMNQLIDYPISLHILGNCSISYAEKLKSLSVRSENINFIEPVALADIFKIASRFDVGLATEVPHCLNREICLTNKIFTYLLAGNCIIASDTQAQRIFLAENPGIGLLYSNEDASQLASQLEKISIDRDFLFRCRLNSLVLASKSLNWENESKKLLSVIEKIVR